MWQGLHHGVNFLEVKLIWEVCVAWKRSDVVLESYRTLQNHENHILEAQVVLPLIPSWSCLRLPLRVANWWF